MMNARVRCSFLAVPLLAALGCSDPVPLPAQAALTLSIQKATINEGGVTCPDPGTTYRFGALKNGEIQNPSNVNHGQSVINGDQGSSIGCSVKSSNGGFAFSASIRGTANSNEPVTVSINGGVITGETGTASVTVSTRKLSTTFSNPSAQPCTFTVIRGAGDLPQVKNGALWATFQCPSIVAPPSGQCVVGTTSTVVLENCDGS